MTWSPNANKKLFSNLPHSNNQIKFDTTIFFSSYNILIKSLLQSSHFKYFSDRFNLLIVNLLENYPIKIQKWSVNYLGVISFEIFVNLNIEMDYICK